MANPTLLTSPIAENGDKNVIPASTGATTGLLDQEHGFQQINELPLQAGGLPPQRKDFNGAFNLLSKILFYAQKGYVFEFDENQDYFAGCITKDTDGGLYCANTDVSASSTHPKDDPTKWALINFGFNKKETFATSGSFTAPVTGIYRIELQGGGGGGGGAGYTINQYISTGSGGSQGGHGVVYERLTAGTSYSFVIGAGGGGGAIKNSGTAGGDTTITVNGNFYEAKGGGQGLHGGGSYAGGEFTINGTTISRGACGVSGSVCVNNVTCPGGAGGGLGGASVYLTTGLQGGGGYGGAHQSDGVNYAGGAGGDGYIAFEYCDI